MNIICPKCKTKSNVPANSGASKFKCPKCGVSLGLPASSKKASLSTPVKMAAQTLACPHCNKHVGRDEQLAGKTVSCPHCHGAFRMPGASVTMEAPAPFPIAVIAPSQSPSQSVIVTPYEDEYKTCPFCAEEILVAAKRCKHCGETVDATLRAAEEAQRLAKEARRAAEMASHHSNSAASASSSTTVIIEGYGHRRASRSLMVAYLLWLFSVHRFYLGRPISGLLYFFTCGACGVWMLLDLLLIPSMVNE